MSRAPQNIRNYFTNYSNCLTPTTVPTIAKAYTSGNGQKIGDALQRAREFIPWNYSNKSGEAHKQKIPSGIKSRSTDKNHENYTSSGLREQQNALDKPYKKYQQNNTKTSENIYLNGDHSQKRHHNNANMHNPEGFNNTDCDLSESSHGFENPFKTKFSDIHNYAANQLLKTVNVNMENVRQWAIFDSGATSNFPMTDAHILSVTPVINPIRVTLPDGSKV